MQQLPQRPSRPAWKRAATSLHLSFGPVRYIPAEIPFRVIDNHFVTGLL